MAFDEDQQAEFIAAEWGVSVELLNETFWELDTIDGNDGELYGYQVRFDDDTDPNLLADLGVEPGNFTRQLSVNAFDEPDGDNETDFDSSRPEQVYLSDGSGNTITDEHGNRIVVGSSAPAETQGTIGGAALNEHIINGPAFAGRGFAGHAFATDNSIVNTDRDTRSSIETLRVEMLARIDILEEAIRQSPYIAPNRGHNHPPELLEIEPPLSQQQILDISTASATLRQESQKNIPDVAIIESQISTFRKTAQMLGVGTLVIAGSILKPIMDYEVVSHYTAHRQQIIEALIEAANATLTWIQHITLPL